MAWKSPSQAWQVMGASARVEAAMRMDRPHGQIAAMKLVLRRAAGAGGGFGVPPEGHGLGQGAELGGVGEPGGGGDGAGGPAVALIVGRRSGRVARRGP